MHHFAKNRKVKHITREDMIPTWRGFPHTFYPGQERDSSFSVFERHTEFPDGTIFALFLDPEIFVMTRANYSSKRTSIQILLASPLQLRGITFLDWQTEMAFKQGLVLKYPQEKSFPSFP
jgi:hypothetical protein